MLEKAVTAPQLTDTKVNKYIVYNFLTSCKSIPAMLSRSQNTSHFTQYLCNIR